MVTAAELDITQYQSYKLKPTAWTHANSIDLRYTVKPFKQISLCCRKSCFSSSHHNLQTVDFMPFASSSWLFSRYSAVCNMHDGQQLPVDVTSMLGSFSKMLSANKQLSAGPSLHQILHPVDLPV